MTPSPAEVLPRLVAAAGAALSGWLLVVVMQHAGRAVYDLPGWAVAVGIGASVVALAAWLVLVRTGGWFGVVTAVVGSVIVASITTVPVIGVLLLAAGIVKLASGNQQSRDKVGFVTGMLLALAVPAAALVASDGPVVECGDRGVSTSGSVLRGSAGSGSAGSGSAGGAGAAAPPAASAGTFRSGGRTYTYRCDGGRLTQFTVR